MASAGPDFAMDESKKEGFVRIRVEIPNLKAKSKFIGKSTEAKNAKIEVDFGDRSFMLTVRGDPVKDMSGRTWTLQSSKLPHAIIKSGSYWTTEDDFVNVFLMKAGGDDWAPYIRKGQLDA